MGVHLHSTGNLFHNLGAAHQLIFLYKQIVLKLPDPPSKGRLVPVPSSVILAAIYFEKKK